MSHQCVGYSISEILKLLNLIALLFVIMSNFDSQEDISFLTNSHKCRFEAFPFSPFCGLIEIEVDSNILETPVGRKKLAHTAVK